MLCTPTSWAPATATMKQKLLSLAFVCLQTIIIYANSVQGKSINIISLFEMVRIGIRIACDIC